MDKDTESDAIRELERHTYALDPWSTLPLDLQRIPFNDDVLRRMRADPLKNPTLAKDQLNDDAETREIIRQVLSAASEREKEVLLHNQSRLFQEILGRTFDALRAFLREPLIPRSWRSPAPAFSDREARPTDPAPPSRGERLARVALSVSESLLTPKYILLVLTALFAGTSIYSRVQVSNLKDALSSYKDATAATNELQSSLTKTVDSFKADKEQFSETIGELRAANLKLDASAHDTEAQLALAKQENAGLLATQKQKDEQLAAFQAQRTDEAKSLQKQYDQEHAELLTATQRAKELEIRVARLESQKAGLETERSLRSKQFDDLERQRDETRTLAANYLNKNRTLEQDKTTLSLARAVIDRVKREIGKWGDADEDAIEGWIADFERAEREVRGH